MGGSQLDLVRLTEVSLDDVLALLNEPRLRRHMPLSTDVTRADAAAWVRAKDAQWETSGYGPWAVLLAGELAGWAGFQAEDDGVADLALVLLPAWWGSGAEVARAVLARGFGELGLPEVVVTLPLTRDPGRALTAFGFAPDDEVKQGGTRFRRFRLTRAAFDKSGAARNAP